MEKGDPAHRNPFRLRAHSTLRHFAIAFVGLVCFFTSTVYVYGPTVWESHLQIHQLPPHAADTLARCRSLSQTPPTTASSKRTVSDRFAPGTRPHFLKNARVWTGNKNGTEVIIADILLESGLIKGVGRISPSFLAAYADELVVMDLKGAWVTPGSVYPFIIFYWRISDGFLVQIALSISTRISEIRRVQSSRAQAAMITLERVPFYHGYVP